MFLNFFLSFESFRSGFSGSTYKSQATDANHYVIPRKQKTTFNTLLGSLSSVMNRESQFLYTNYATRTVLVNLSDESMFQLETLCVPEYCYCTYNLDTKIIGFGNSILEAYEATREDNMKSGNVGYGKANYNYMIQFYPQKDEDEPFEFTCPYAFYEQVLAELKPYIKYEKNIMFKNCTDILEREQPFLSKFFDSYYQEGRESVEKYYGTSIRTYEFKYTVKMFMEDDPDILEKKDFHESGLRILGSLCFKMMQMTDETF